MCKETSKLWCTSGDGIADYAWCSADPADKSRCCYPIVTDAAGNRDQAAAEHCKSAIFATVQSYNGCDHEQNKPWMLLNAPQVFARVGDCVCTCDVPRCYDGKYNSWLQSRRIQASGNLKDECFKSMLLTRVRAWVFTFEWGFACHFFCSA